MGVKTDPREVDLRTLDTLVLKTLTGGRRHGYGIARAIEEATDSVVAIEEGSLYPALYRMERKGWVEAEWSLSELGRRAIESRETVATRTGCATPTQPSWSARACG